MRSTEEELIARIMPFITENPRISNELGVTVQNDGEGQRLYKQPIPLGQ
ncbi:MAG: hypothetical protein OXL40_07685 [Bacteroidota bacterium]|nr:hypothetical protein [Bacteroidota bacterium]